MLGELEMTFNSYIYLFVFFPLVIVLYYALGIICKNAKNANRILNVYLSIASGVFLAYSGLYHLVVLIGFIVVNYALMVAHKKSRQVRITKFIIRFAIFLNVLFLLIALYTGFVTNTLKTTFSIDFNVIRIVAPLGISFYTFQQVAMWVEIGKGNVGNIRIDEYILFATFFPKVLSGPILSYPDFVAQLQIPNRGKINYSNLAHGITIFILGLSKKVLLADALGAMVNYGFWNGEVINSANVLIMMLSYTFEIYFDFSGYCDMASGVSEILNVNLPINFDSPYKAYNIRQFWDRWHMTLTGFLTRYIYIPLGGSKKGRIRTYINVMLVFVVSGFWHGAEWSFVIWGVLHGIASCLHRGGQKWIDKTPKLLQWAVLFCFLNISWFIFRCGNLSTLQDILSRLRWEDLSLTNISDDMIRCMVSPIARFFAVNGMLPFGENKLGYIVLIATFIVSFFICLVPQNNQRRQFKYKWYTCVGISLLFAACIISLGTMNTFIYVSF